MFPRETFAKKKGRKRMKRAKYNALDLAKYIVSKCFLEGWPISNLQLQKILYFIQKDFLQRNDMAFADEIQAWQFGPVVPGVYYRFCGFGALPIANVYEDCQDVVNENDKEYTTPIIREKRKMSPWALVEETHIPGGAWDRVYQNGKGENNPIPLDYIIAEA